MAVFVCSIKDIECGDREANWCPDCPKRTMWRHPAPHASVPRVPSPGMTLRLTADEQAVMHGALLRSATILPERPAAWVPVAERLPTHGTPVLITWKSGDCAVSIRRGKYWRVATDDSEDVEYDAPDYWMPLPPPPGSLK